MKKSDLFHKCYFLFDELFWSCRFLFFFKEDVGENK